jgi:prolyl-tRNA synthetase
MSNFYCGANENDHHLGNVNWDRDVSATEVVDLRNVEAGDPSPCGDGKIVIKRGIEVGHIFQLGDKYSNALNCSVLNENGKDQVVTMGCYGIGITRVVASAIEQNYDDNGIKWPAALAPFQVAIAPINYHKSEKVAAACDELYQQLTAAGVEVLLMDAEKARLGGILADIELVGITHRVVIGDRGLESGEIEYRHRHAAENESLAVDNLLTELLARVNG